MLRLLVVCFCSVVHRTVYLCTQLSQCTHNLQLCQAQGCVVRTKQVPSPCHSCCTCAFLLLSLYTCKITSSSPTSSPRTTSGHIADQKTLRCFGQNYLFHTGTFRRGLLRRCSFRGRPCLTIFFPCAKGTLRL